MLDWSNFWAPLCVGVLLWLLAEACRAWLSRVGRRQARRRKIISLMGRAAAVQERAIREGDFDLAYSKDSRAPLAVARAQYDDLTARALDLFEPGEEVVAFWTAAEFYASWHAPTQRLREINAPRDPKGRKLRDYGLDRGWVPARPELLAEWAQDRRPWNTGNERGPRYADRLGAGDRTRHNIVIPNSDVNVDMMRPFILYLDGAAVWRKPSRREEAHLRRMFGDSPSTSENFGA